VAISVQTGEASVGLTLLYARPPVEPARQNVTVGQEIASSPLLPGVMSTGALQTGVAAPGLVEMRTLSMPSVTMQRALEAHVKGPGSTGAAVATHVGDAAPGLFEAYT
jgi:hypothetical protein